MLALFTYCPHAPVTRKYPCAELICDPRQYRCCCTLCSVAGMSTRRWNPNLTNRKMCWIARTLCPLWFHLRTALLRHCPGKPSSVLVQQNFHQTSAPSFQCHKPVTSCLRTVQPKNPPWLCTGVYRTNASNSITFTACLINKKFVWQQLQKGFSGVFLFSLFRFSDCRKKTKI